MLVAKREWSQLRPRASDRGGGGALHFYDSGDQKSDRNPQSGTVSGVPASRRVQFHGMRSTNGQGGISEKITLLSLR